MKPGIGGESGLSVGVYIDILELPTSKQIFTKLTNVKNLSTVVHAVSEIYIYIYIEREKETDTERETDRERRRDREGERERGRGGGRAGMILKFSYE